MSSYVRRRCFHVHHNGSPLWPNFSLQHWIPCPAFYLRSLLLSLSFFSLESSNFTSKWVIPVNIQWNIFSLKKTPLLLIIFPAPATLFSASLCKNLSLKSCPYYLFPHPQYFPIPLPFPLSPLPPLEPTQFKLFFTHLWVEFTKGLRIARWEVQLWALT